LTKREGQSFDMTKIIWLSQILSQMKIIKLLLIALHHHNFVFLKGITVLVVDIVVR